MRKIEFRPLRADEVEVRIGTVKIGKGVSLLLYKDARCDMNILDETMGATGWKKRYDVIDGQLFCTIEIWDEEKNQWVGKQDVGTDSNTEPEKGRASDAQKRAAFAWGIGRELYSSPFIWISGGTKDDRFWVKELESADKRITKLTICKCNEYGDKTDEVAYEFPWRGNKPKIDPIRTPKIERVKSIYRGDNLVKLLDKYGVSTLDELSTDQLVEIVERYDASRKEKA